MRRPSAELVRALRETADRLARSEERYQWGHMGACNCGHLAQTVTRLDRAEIHRRAMERAGDWGDQVVEFCPTSGLAIDHVIDAMLALGLERRDLLELERLSGTAVLRRLPPERRDLRRNRREDVVLYLRTFADRVEEALPPPPAAPAPATEPVLVGTP